MWTSLWQGSPPVAIPNLYAALARVLPGLDAVRVPARVDSGYHLGVCLLAGIGAASLLQRFARYAPALGAILVAASLIETLVLPSGSEVAGPPIVSLRVAPAREDLELFEELIRMGNSGALLELPMGDRAREFVFQSPRRILLSAYHHRRTSACYGSFFPPGRKQLRDDALDLPAAGALARICERGFTTVLIHTESPRGAYAADQLRRASEDPRGGIAYLTASASIAAFKLCDAGTTAARSGENPA